MSWAEIKKAINTNIAKPLDILIKESFDTNKNNIDIFLQKTQENHENSKELFAVANDEVKQEVSLNQARITLNVGESRQIVTLHTYLNGNYRFHFEIELNSLTDSGYFEYNVVDLAGGGVISAAVIHIYKGLGEKKELYIDFFAKKIGVYALMFRSAEGSLRILAKQAKLCYGISKNSQSSYIYSNI